MCAHGRLYGNGFELWCKCQQGCSRGCVPSGMRVARGLLDWNGLLEEGLEVGKKNALTGDAFAQRHRGKGTGSEFWGKSGEGCGGSGSVEVQGTDRLSGLWEGGGRKKDVKGWELRAERVEGWGKQVEPRK